jgi:tRNA 2-thiouridine synthesizing protein A
MDSSVTSGNHVDEVLDARGLFCPMPIIKINQTIKKMTPGQIVKVLATDPGSKKDFESWCTKTGNKLLHFSEENGVFTYLVQKVS